MDYVAPSQIATVDIQAIHARMLENLPLDIDKTEGGFAWDFTMPAALEEANIMVMLNDILQIFFPEWSYGIYLDLIGKRDGIIRRAGTKAQGKLVVTGNIGTVIPAGFKFATAETALASNMEFETLEEVELDNGDNIITVRCTQVGLAGNTPANAVTLMSSPLRGIETINNPQPITGGTDPESDDSLRARIIERDRNNDMSYVGNEADYKRWARECSGVGSVIVMPEWQGKGTGTVKVIVMDANGNQANEDIIERVYQHIVSPDNVDSRLAPIGAIVTVGTADPVGLVIRATVHLEPGAKLEDVRLAYINGINTYFVEAKEESCVYYTRVGSVLSETAGVLDYEELTVDKEDDPEPTSGHEANIPIAADEFPSIAKIILIDADNPEPDPEPVPDPEPTPDPEPEPPQQPDEDEQEEETPPAPPDEPTDTGDPDNTDEPPADQPGGDTE